MKTLEELEQLEQSRFGRPRPRHGLKLLYWFANDCLSLNQNNVLQLCCYPETGDFGFHIFENRDEKYSGKLLPDVNFPYYVLGNLGKFRARELPLYVQEDYTGSQDNSNMDRIIISINNETFHTVYVTEHSDRSNFNKYATYCISRHLIMIIRGLNLDDFLVRSGYSKLPANISYTIPANILTYPSNSQALYPAPSTTSSNISAISAFSFQDDCIDMESPPVLMDNNTQQQTPTAEWQWNNFVQDNTKMSNLQYPSQHNQPTSTYSPTTRSSRNQDTKIEIDSDSQTDSHATTQTCPTSLLNATKRWLCTIL